VTDVVQRSDFRERLLVGLAASIREKGLQGTQISDIVRHARTSRRTFYECFPDKESCFLELIEESTQAILEHVGAAVDPAAPWTTQVDQAVGAYLDALAGDPALIVTISRELPALGTRGAAYLHDSIERFAELLIRLIASSQTGGTAAIRIEEAVMLTGGVAELVGRASTRGEDLRALAPPIERVIKAALDPGA
jgi:AcrR family transcriptional regulator